jgi:hypothetical protein
MEILNQFQQAVEKAVISIPTCRDRNLNLNVAKKPRSPRPEVSGVAITAGYRLSLRGVTTVRDDEAIPEKFTFGEILPIPTDSAEI